MKNYLILLLLIAASGQAQQQPKTIRFTKGFILTITSTNPPVYMGPVRYRAQFDKQVQNLNAAFDSYSIQQCSKKACVVPEKSFMPAFADPAIKPAPAK